MVSREAGVWIGESRPNAGFFVVRRATNDACHEADHHPKKHLYVARIRPVIGHVLQRDMGGDAPGGFAGPASQNWSYLPVPEGSSR